MTFLHGLAREHEGISVRLDFVRDVVPIDGPMTALSFAGGDSPWGEFHRRGGGGVCESR